MRAVLILLCVTATEAAADPMAADFEGRGFFDAQLGLGASAVDGLDFATAWSIAAGLRIVPHTYLVARLRHTSPFYNSLAYDLGTKLLFDVDPDEPGVDSTRTHETDLSLGTRVRWRRLWAEAALAGALVYRIGDQRYDTRAHLMVDTTIGVQLSAPSTARDEHFDGMLFVETSFSIDGDFMKAILGVSITIEVM